MEFCNRRRFQRVRFDGMVNLAFRYDRYECCQVKNLSLTGMCVAGNFNLKKKKNCSIRIFHNGTTGNNSLTASAEVVWWNDGGLGLRFTSMTLANYELLQETLARNAEEPQVILREIPYKYPFDISEN